MGLDTIINDRIGLGTYQIQALLIIALLVLLDGVEVVLSSFLNTIIKAIYPDISSSYISAVTSTFYIGLIFGSIASGHVADKYGRRVVIKYGAIVQIISAFFFYLANSLVLMIIVRLFYGFCFGFTIASSTSLFA